jgi:hypothetical protein
VAGNGFSTNFPDVSCLFSKEEKIMPKEIENLNK